MEIASQKPRASLTEENRINFRLWLQRQFTERCKRNARYSLRAFAKALELDPSTVSQILSGKRTLSKKTMHFICSKLSTNPIELNLFGIGIAAGNAVDSYYQTSLDTFSIISDWYHYAILELTFVSGFQADPRWIAKRLSITAEEARCAIERLKRVGLLLEENGSLIKSARSLTNHSSVDTSSAHRELQRQVVSKALNAIDICNAEEKDITSMTMAIDVKNLDRARVIICKFRRDLCALLEDGDQSRVYNLAIQLYPISKNDHNWEEVI